jgi:diguanylate cyclase (GGDEF)-like protein
LTSDKIEKILHEKTEDPVEILRRVAKALTSAVDLNEILEKIMKVIAELFKPRDWSLLMKDEETEELYFAIAVGEAGERLKTVRLKPGEGIAGWVAKNQEPLITEDAYKDPRFARWVDTLTGFKTGAVACIPLISKGRTLGVIELFSADEKKFSVLDLKLLEALADFTAIAIENAKYIQTIKDLTIIDDVTGLYNSRHMHTLLEAEISRSRREKTPFSIIFLDLDFFKNVNDNFDHLVGSRLLREVGQLFKQSLRSIDWAIRYGGDEFILLLPGSNKEDAIGVAKRLREYLNQNIFFRKEKFNIKITASFGVATFPDDAKHKEDLLRLADMAMYEVKKSGRDGIASA